MIGRSGSGYWKFRSRDWWIAVVVKGFGLFVPGKLAYIRCSAIRSREDARLCFLPEHTSIIGFLFAIWIGVRFTRKEYFLCLVGGFSEGIDLTYAVSTMDPKDDRSAQPALATC